MMYNPFSMAPQKALETIGKTLSSQYERWQPRALYKYQLDPTVEEVKKLCNACRKSAKSERVLFHYNGHGVPKPTSNGEIWLFNRSYTQYIPLPISDLDSWLKTPSIYVFDCSAAGMIVNAFNELNDWSTSGSSRDCILLAACEAHETLPQSAEFPADMFTSCLTTPIKMALRWFCKHSLLCESVDESLIDKIPGRQNDRKTLLGELNWIFTAVTDTIAWNVLPHDLFQRLFRQDLLVASLLRNFLLAERIMRSANCSPISHPMLPPTHQHRMWDAWDMAAEICLAQLPSLIQDPTAKFPPSPFFSEQLTAFEVWLDHGSEDKKPPEQLPIVLQVLRSQFHQFRALVLLGRFLDMGTWAVDLALSVGIFPYILKLLQTTTPELRQILVFIWTKILALDKVDLVKDGGHSYFIRFLDSVEAYPEQRAMAAFVLAVTVDGHRRGQEACIESGLIHVCLKHIQGSSPNDSQADPLFLQWLCLCMGKLWEDFTEAQILGFQADAPAIYATLLSEPQPEVRACAVFALGTLLDMVGDSCRYGAAGDDECYDDEKIRAEISIVRSLLTVVSDGSPLVRAEVAVALARFAFGHNKHLKSIAAAHWKPRSNSLLNSLPSLAHITSTNTGYGSSDQYMQHGNIVSSQIGSVLRVSNDNTAAVQDGRVSASSPLANSGIMHGAPLSDDSSQHSDSGILNDGVSNVVVNDSRAKPLDKAMYSQCILAMRTLAKDPSPRIASLGRRVLSIIGIEQVVAKPMRTTSGNVRPGEPTTAPASPNLAGLARSSSWFDMNGGHLPLTFRTPPASPSQPSYFTGMRRVCSLEFRPHLINSPDSGLAHPLLGSGGSSGPSEQSLLPQSTIYNWSSGYFSKLLLTASDYSEEMLARREEREKFALEQIAKCQHSFSDCGTYLLNNNNQIAGWDAKFETGTKTTLLHPFSPIVIAADENARIRIWNYEEAIPLNSFDNHDYPEKGITKLCLVNELDDSLLLAASGDGNIRIWKDYNWKNRQNLVTAFSSIQGHQTGMRSLNAVVDWPAIWIWNYEEAIPLNSFDNHDYPEKGITKLCQIWNYEEAIPLNSFDNHDYPEKGITKLCLVNELDDSLLLAASGDGNIRIWKDYNWKNRQNLVTAFSSIQGHQTGMRSLNAVVDWQQQSGYLYATGEISSIMLWDLDREQLVNSIPSSSDCSISALAASQVQGGQFAAGFVDASVRIYDVRTPKMLVLEMRPHLQNVERVVGIGYQPGLDSAKIVSASQAGDIQFLDTRNHRDAYLTIDAHRGSLTALAVHRHAPIIASGSAKQLIKVFSLKGEQLGTIQYLHTSLGQKISSLSCLTFHPYQVLLAAGAVDG
ncbi:Regulatory-associated protein of TOR 1 [Morella rubra]|uniref:Regulatory-associated protein of TOR 1 n=1 Tax=Morella rubra TaxID=262757 RepID=A0A6A1WIC2_9ROSI|nr:Regulatory-associated protein of TOR 1 [Morella rubra]